eukprot:CAMPEP_0178513226 /NCGR_PEP_ID=MMETSP0696-20121128/23358_1 /TAXON_ID=265572 /ORGANISM="Extubocellulus spinifer, Strain CCMP396" /LENGTH=54 /DNA_ID=CAMNT_0020143203 /DNA_START=95 /DNA_END=256 /DNA_ORIENTATION=-
MAVTTALMPPSLAIAILLALLLQARFRRAPQACTCTPADPSCCRMAVTTALMPP